MHLQDPFWNVKVSSNPIKLISESDVCIPESKTWVKRNTVYRHVVDPIWRGRSQKRLSPPSSVFLMECMRLIIVGVCQLITFYGESILIYVRKSPRGFRWTWIGFTADTYETWPLNACLNTWRIVNCCISFVGVVLFLYEYGLWGQFLTWILHTKLV